MSVQSYPWTASVFKGEGRFLITTLVEHVGGYKTHADEVTIVSETEDDLVDKLGNKVLSRIKAVEKVNKLACQCYGGRNRKCNN